MRISDIISLGKSYLLLGIVLAVVAAALFILGYRLLYKKIMKGQKALPKARLFWLVVFVCYLVVVLGATMFSRGSWYENGRVMPLFYSYKEAWNGFEARQWRNIILNILMFVPFGFLLPLCIRKFECFWKTYLAGLLFTVTIELLQLVLKKGIFEFDDIFNNFCGAMIGYGFFAIMKLLAGFIEKEKRSVGRTLALQLPLFAVIVLFGTIFLIYNAKELGNVSSAYIIPVNKKILEIEKNADFSNDTVKLKVYRTKRFTVDETKQLAMDFFALQEDSIDESRTDIYEETAVYYSMNGRSLWIDYQGGACSFTDFDVKFSGDEVKTDSSKTEQQIRAALEEYGVAVPKGAIFENRGDGKYTFTAEQLCEDGMMYDGTLSCAYYENGKLGDIRNDILQCELYKEFTAISQEEAYKMILSGKFRYYVGDSDVLKMQIGQASIGYEMDSKGFYQPVYLFEAVVNGQDSELVVPALK